MRIDHGKNVPSFKTIKSYHDIAGFQHSYAFISNSFYYFYSNLSLVGVCYNLVGKQGSILIF